ncbi:Mitochondrial import inner membrane translocase subunit Tim17-A, partial [Ceratobasidium sp. 392]
MAIGIKAQAPAVAGNFAAWGGLFSAFNCAALHYRRVEDGWNDIFAGAASSGCLAVR